MGGTAFTTINAALSQFETYELFRSNKLSATTYQAWVEQNKEILGKNLNTDQMNLSARFPGDKHDLVRRALSHCRAHDMVNSEDYNDEEVEQTIKETDKSYDHDKYTTYIFPEENALLHAIVRNFKPKSAIFMGSYYGYWAATAKKAHPPLRITLVDINPDVMNLARRNFETVGIASGVDFVVADAEVTVGQCQRSTVDLLVLDAEGPKSIDVPEDYRDKAIYYPHLRAALHSLVPGALLVAHNVILSNFTHGVYFEEKQRYYRGQYVKFLSLVRENFVCAFFDTTEGTLIARKR